MRPDPLTVAAAIRETAVEEVLPRFRRLAAADRWQKAQGSIVTVADRAAEARLARMLTGILPGARVVGEEAAEDDPAVFAAFDEGDPTWVIDPIDGTSNFADGTAIFAMIVALVVRGRTAMGWIHDPVRNRTVIAEAGAGAYEDFSRLRIDTPAPPIAAMTGSLGNRLRRDPAIAGRFAAVTRARCCGQEYMALVGNRLHFALYRNLKPWDHAAGVLIHAEAGGHAAGLDGAPYRPPPARDGSLLLAPDRESWTAIAALLASPARPA